MKLVSLPPKFRKSSKRLTLRDLIEQESIIGGRLFGERASNERLKFYNLDLHNWYFYQEIIDKFGKVQSVTMHYEVHPHGIMRATLGSEKLFEPLVGEELSNFMKATELYHKHIMEQIYINGTQTDKKLR